jgi:hypothetical protein
MKNQELRRAAFEAGKTRYNTGVPCKHGHVADRYVSNGGCVECVMPFKQTRNAFDKEAAPYTPAGLWARKTYSESQRATLRDYLQQCIDAFDRSACPDAAPLMYKREQLPASILTPTTAPPGARVAPPLDTLPSAEYSDKPERCEHGIDAGFCSICDE